jgi:hypothetical protein
MIPFAERHRRSPIRKQYSSGCGFNREIEYAFGSAAPDKSRLVLK